MALLIVLQLLFVEGILSLDNAAILGAMVAHLPNDQPMPWPKGLSRLGQHLDRLLGPQQTAALRAGLLGAYLWRSLMLIAAAWIVQNPGLKLLGALYLLKLAAGALGPSAEDTPKPPSPICPSHFWRTVGAVELADLAFSLDNVVAAVSLTNRLALILSGVFLGILMMRFAAGLFARLVQREPVLEPAAYVIVLNISLGLLLGQLTGVHVSELAQLVLSAGTLTLALMYAHWPAARALAAPLLWGAGRILGAINRLCEQAVHVALALLSMRISEG